MTKKFKSHPGAIIEIRTSSGYRYIRLVNKNRSIHVFRVTDQRSLEPIADISTVSSARTLYYFQSNGPILLNDERFLFIGVAPIEAERPPFRRAFGTGWIVVDEGSETFVPNPIDEETARISIEAGIPAGLVVTRLEEWWLPQHDRVNGLLDVLRRARPAMRGNERETVFYIDFDSALSASKACDELRKNHYAAKVESGKRSVAVTYLWNQSDNLRNMDAIEDQLASHVKRFGGSISGRETSA